MEENTDDMQIWPTGSPISPSASKHDRSGGGDSGLEGENAKTPDGIQEQLAHVMMTQLMNIEKRLIVCLL